MLVVARLKPSATRNQQTKNVQKVSEPWDGWAAISATVRSSPVRPMPEPNASMCLSWVRRVKNIFRNRNGKMQIPRGRGSFRTRRATSEKVALGGPVHPTLSAGLLNNRLIVADTAPGDKVEDVEENIGTFDCHAPSMKKHVIANQHIVTTTPH